MWPVTKDVAGDQVAAQAVAERKGPLEVNPVPFLQIPKVGLV
jgi:hypothetical protein